MSTTTQLTLKELREQFEELVYEGMDVTELLVSVDDLWNWILIVYTPTIKKEIIGDIFNKNFNNAVYGAVRSCWNGHSDLPLERLPSMQKRIWGALKTVIKNKLSHQD